MAAVIGRKSVTACYCLQNGFRGEFLGPQEFGDAVASAVRTLPRSMPVAVLAIPPIGEVLDSVSNATVRQYVSVPCLELVSVNHSLCAQM